MISKRCRAPDALIPNLEFQIWNEHPSAGPSDGIPTKPPVPKAVLRQTYARGIRMRDSLMMDLRFAGRMLRKSPVFTIVAASCIAIGSGAMATIFSAMNALVLRPLPGAADAARLVRMERKRPGGNDGVSASYPLYQWISARARSLSAVAASGKGAFTLRAGEGVGVAVYGNFVTDNFFNVLGVRPKVGRFFAPREEPVIVVSEGFWRSYLGADSSAIGREIAVNGHRYTLVGVAPSEFQGVDAPIRTDAWIPIAMRRELRPNTGPLADVNATWLRLCARLAPGVSIDAAHRDVAALTASFVKEATEPSVYRDYTDMQFSQLSGLPPDASRPLAFFLILLLGAAALVLLIASVNVASMLSARAIARQREMAVRSALGASRGRLVRQLLTEILVLFALGAAGGTVIAEFATAAFERMPIPGALPFALELSPDWRVFSFALGIALVTGVVFGLAPSLQAAAKDIALRMREGSFGSGTRRSRATSVLVIGQLALSLVLLISAGLFLQALQLVARDALVRLRRPDEEDPALERQQQSSRERDDECDEEGLGRREEMGPEIGGAEQLPRVADRFQRRRHRDVARDVMHQLPRGEEKTDEDCELASALELRPYTYALAGHRPPLRSISTRSHAYSPMLITITTSSTNRMSPYMTPLWKLL